MKKWIIRKPAMYRAMREASFSSGIATSIAITFVIWVVYSMVREIPAGLIDTGYSLYSSFNHYNYITDPGTMLISLSLTTILIALVLLYVKRVEQRSLSTIGLSRQHVLPRFGFGFLLGVLLLTAYALLELFTWSFTYSGFKPIALLFFPAFIVQAVSEELLYRGYLLSSLTAKTGVIPAVLISSAVFTFLQIGNHGSNVLSLTNLFLIAVLAAFLTIRTGSLWAACGVHAAWSFTAGLLFPAYYGHLHTSYSLFSMKFMQFNRGVWGDLEVLPAIPLGFIMIALVLFVGKNRLVVRPTEAEQMYFRALHIAKTALSRCKDDFGKPYIRHPLAVAQMLDGDTGRITVLLAAACNTGGLDAGSLTGFSEDVMLAVRALVRGDDTDLEYGLRVRANHTALEVWKAQIVFEEKLLIEKTEWNRRRSKAASHQSDIWLCPMLRRDIRRAECLDIVSMVDSYADDDAHAALRYLDRSRCIRCAKHGNTPVKPGPLVPQSMQE